MHLSPFILAIMCRHLRRLLLAPALWLLFLADASIAQHSHGSHSQYADQNQSHIPSLTVDELAQIESGAGMGFAKPAELNHYPGPKHVLELADSLDLTNDQRLLVDGVQKKMADRAAELGREYLHAEQELNRLFSTGDATETAVITQSSKVGEIRSALRAVHLIAHVETAAVLTEQQIQRYDELRGYGTKQ